jgi:hypothetical protein
MGSAPSNNPVDYMGRTISQRWIGHERGARIRRHFHLDIRLQGTFWPTDHEPGDPDAHLCVFTGTMTDAEDCVRDLGGSLLRLREADPPLGNYVYYALVDSLRRVVPVYDWRDAQAKYEQQWKQVVALGPAAARELGLGRVREGEPVAYIFDWLRSRSRRYGAAEIKAMAAASRDSWARKTVEAALLLEEAAASIPARERARFDAYPRKRLGNVAGIIEPHPALVVTASEYEMDPTEGMAREYMRSLRRFRVSASARIQGPAPALLSPAICLPLRASTPATLHAAKDRFERVCAVLGRAANLLDLLAKWERKRKSKPADPQPVRVQVTV